MGPGVIAAAGEWAGCLSCAVTAISGYARMARAKGGWREAPAWTAPLVFTSAAIMLLVVFGTLALIPWLAIGLIPLAVVAARAVRAWREIAKLRGSRAATATVLGLLAARLRGALRNAREDLRALAGLRPRAKAARDPETRAGFVQGLIERTRHVPPLLEDDLLGDAPARAEVTGSLMAAGTVVWPEYEALAARIRDFDPDGDEDEMIGFADELAAGHLVLGEVFEDLTERLLNDFGLDPAFAVGFFDVAEGETDLAGVLALLVRRYREVYGAIHEHVEGGGTLPKGDARVWFHADGGGAAA